MRYKTGLLLILNAIIFNFTLSYPSFAQDIQLTPPEQDYSQANSGSEIMYQNNEEDPAITYYSEAMDFLNNNECSKAIDSFEKALKLAPDRDSIRVNLAVAYINRGTYFYNSEKNFEKAASDYRNAIYLLNFDKFIPTMQGTTENLNIANVNMDNVYKDAGINSAKSNRLKIARELRGQGKFKEAIVEFNKSIAGNQTDFPVYGAIGELYSALGLDANAAKFYQKAVALDNSSIDTRFKLAKALDASGQEELAIQNYDITLSTAKGESKKQVLDALQEIWTKKTIQNPQNADAHMNLGVVLQKKEMYDAALSEYQTAQNLNPNDITLRLNIGTLYQANHDYPNAIGAYDSILAVHPDYTLVHFYRGTALKETGKPDEAIKEFLTVLNKEPANNEAKNALYETIKLLPNPKDIDNIYKTFAINNPSDPVAQYKYAFHMHSQNNFNEALAYYKKTIALNPKFTDAYLNTAVIYKQKNQLSDAAATIQNGLIALPNNAQLKDMMSSLNSENATEKFQHAINLYNSGKYAESIAEYQKIILISEPDSDIYLNLGAAYQASKKYTDSIASYKKSIEINPKNSTAYYYLGTVYSAQFNNTEAVKYYTKALAIDPANNDIKQALQDAKQAIKDYQEKNSLQKGIDLYNKGKYNEALLQFNTLAMKNTENSDIYYYRGMVYDQLKKYQLAIADYKLAIKCKPDFTYAYYAVGVDYDLLKNYSEAKRWYRVFVDKSGTSADQFTKYAKDRIKKIP